jgi:hypothetical protein
MKNIINISFPFFCVIFFTTNLQAQLDTVATFIVNERKFSFIANKRDIGLDQDVYSPVKLIFESNYLLEPRMLWHQDNIFFIDKESIAVNDSLIVFFAKMAGTGDHMLINYRIKYASKNMQIINSIVSFDIIYSGMETPTIDRYQYNNYEHKFVDINTVQIIYTRNINSHYYDSDHILHVETTYKKFHRFIRYDGISKATIYQIEPIESTYQWLFEREYALQKYISNN